MADYEIYITGLNTHCVGKHCSGQLLIFAYRVKPQLSFELILYQENKNKPSCRWHFFISAKTGEIIFRYNSIKTTPPLTNGIHKTITGNILEGEGGVTTNLLGRYN